MEDHSIIARGDLGPVPPDDAGRRLVVARPEDAGAQHISVVGDTYTIIVSGKETSGRYCLIDMLVPDGSGPPPHRHDFEELFTLLDGELEFTFRGETQRVAAPASVNIPANAPHNFKNASGRTVHMLCMCTPAGQDEFFLAIGDPVESRDAPPLRLSSDEQDDRRHRAADLALKYRTDFLR